MRNLSHTGDIGREQIGVADGFCINRFGFSGDRRGYRLWLGVDEPHRDAQFWQGVMKEIVGSAVEAGGGNDLVAGTGQC